MSFSVIIPSQNTSNLFPCAEAVRKCEPHARLLVMDDGMMLDHALAWLPRPDLEPMQVAICPMPFIFSQNCNIGIREAGADDVVLLNDDALLESSGGFSLLERECAAHPEIGLIGCTSNIIGASGQVRQRVGLRLVDRVCFVGVYIPRRTINLVGLLDERFTAYGSEDTDYVRRVHNAGLSCAVHDDCFVDHGSLRSTFRGDPRAPGDCEEGRRIFVEKWGTPWNDISRPTLP